MKQLSRAGLALMCLAQPIAGAAHEPIDTIDYTELSPPALLPAVITSLKHSRKDLQSIRDLTICRPYRLRLKLGRPHAWAIMISFDVKNHVGEYEGVTKYVVAFKDGAVLHEITKVRMTANNGLNRLLDKAIDEDMRGCESIPDESTREMLRNTP